MGPASFLPTLDEGYALHSLIQVEEAYGRRDKIAARIMNGSAADGRRCFLSGD
jgi:hypothetical protein